MRYLHLTVTLLSYLLVTANVAHSADCDPYKIKHIPDKSIEYQEGKDSRGFEVAPADISASSNFLIKEPESVEINLNEPIKARIQNADAYNVNLDESTINIDKIKVPLKGCEN